MARGASHDRDTSRRGAVGRDIAKRTFDVIAASALLVLLSPIILAIAAAVRLKLGPPVIYRLAATRPPRPALHHVQVPHDA